MALETGQSSGRFAEVAPSVVFVPNFDQEEGRYVMAFQSADDSNRLLVITSEDGHSWGPLIESGQTTQAAPALVVVEGRLFAFFISNDNSNRILYGQVIGGKIPVFKETGDTGHSVTAVPGLFGPNVLYFFVANDHPLPATGRLLGGEINVAFF